VEGAVTSDNSPGVPQRVKHGLPVPASYEAKSDVNMSARKPVLASQKTPN
jgi:hypothetical protein